MTLFIQVSQKRGLIFNDAYVMALTFIVCFLVARISKEMITKKIKQAQERKKRKSLTHIKGGSLTLDATDQKDLAELILSYVKDFGVYKLKDPRMINLIFNLVQANVERESIILSPRLIRFLALSVTSKAQVGNNIALQAGKIIVSTDNFVRLKARIIISAAIGLTGGLFSLVAHSAYTLIVLFIAYHLTEKCGYTITAPDYFEVLQAASGRPEVVQIYEETPNGHVFIAENDKEFELFIEEPQSREILIKEQEDNTKVKVIKKTYKSSRKKPKMVTFEQFRKTDPVLSKFNNIDMEEPYVPQKICEVEPKQVIKTLDESIE